MTDLVGAVEDLYLGVVTDPRKWSEQSFVDWSESVALDVAFDKELARYVRQAMRIAQKLQYFWRSADSRPDLEWTSKVDLALGPRAWRPILDLARAQLRTDPSEESFEEVVRLFPLVNNESFMDGIEFNQWSQQR